MDSNIDMLWSHPLKNLGTLFCLFQVYLSNKNGLYVAVALSALLGLQNAPYQGFGKNQPSRTVQINALPCMVSIQAMKPNRTITDKQGKVEQLLNPKGSAPLPGTPQTAFFSSWPLKLALDDFRVLAHVWKSFVHR